MLLLLDKSEAFCELNRLQQLELQLLLSRVARKVQNVETKKRKHCIRAMPAGLTFPFAWLLSVMLEACTLGCIDTISNLVFWSRLANKLEPWHDVYIIQQ